MCDTTLVIGLLIVAAELSFTIGDGSITVVNRDEWGAQPSASPLSPFSKVPPPYVIISHTATAPCISSTYCPKIVQSVQSWHMEGNGWSDIGYNFLVGGDGLIYEGRGWDYIGAHAYNYNSRSIGLSFIGTFNSVKPNEEQLRAAQLLLEYGVKIGKLPDDYKLLGHRQVSQTTSPGDKLFQIIKTWSHWSEKA